MFGYIELQNDDLMRHIDEHKIDNGGLEFYLAKAKRPSTRNQRTLFMVLAVLFFFFGYLTLVVAISKDFEEKTGEKVSGTLTILILFVYLFIVARIEKRLFLEVERTGIIKFTLEEIEIKDLSGQVIQTFMNNQIKKINYNLIIPKPGIHRYEDKHNCKLYGITFCFWEGQPVKVEIENEIIASKDKYINKPKLSLFEVVKSINPKYGLWEM